MNRAWICLWMTALAALGCLCAAPGGASPAAPLAASAPASQPARVEVTFLHINDTHGQTQGSGGAGGYPRLATAIQQVRSAQAARAARVFLVDCGDILSRSDDLTRRTLGAANVELMNLLRFDAYVPGNGDYYDGPKVLRALIRQAKFPTLAANVTFHKAPLARLHVIEQAGDVRIALTGLCFIKEPADGLGLADPVRTLREQVAALQGQADAIVVLSHLGLKRDLEIARTVAGIDVIIGGHTHAVLPAGLAIPAPGGRTVRIVQAGEQLRYLGRLDLSFEKRPAPDTGYRLAHSSASLIELNKNIPEDPQVKAKLARLSGTARPVQPAPATAP